MSIFSAENEGVSEMQLLDLTGRIIKTNTVQAIERNQWKASMDLSELSKGRLCKIWLKMIKYRELRSYRILFSEP
ncbi:MAG: hypothetical protein IPL22_18525 [Bacteroidetes bacterium]|nr:hypothetical protein [Bacteroidota bacterium]